MIVEWNRVLKRQIWGYYAGITGRAWGSKLSNYYCRRLSAQRRRGSAHKKYCQATYGVVADDLVAELYGDVLMADLKSGRY